ncbi:MAG: prepilin-type N-terminal cleavage/methylation domain-containing protein [Actinobacteria bacterium]|nr:prepilin-type N-terminal cleavage/methylation domain-containing protein [Actinomycetota bacterium]MBU1609425.1 prepilin-type N-terminal cleavage/methylation domain-containing protein [Actinomycetota bacterium]MBU2315191.1 prepilin-type N-terminal cleavage/methylation domain-containing protein [Actinomycetota bacterium]MBU2384547.1 prepilin-type N-terminal cleavage/methylation domain-containing protein [Actinomycetota bacterium]
MSAPRRSDAGFTLVELLISSALVSVVIVVVGGVLISSMRADETVRTVTTSTTDGQLVANVIDSGMRNSTAVAVSAAEDGVSTFAVARVAGASSAECVAWFYDAEVDTIFRRTSPSAIAAPEPGSVGADWVPLSDGIVPDVDGAGTEYPVFAAEGARGLALRYAVEAGSGPNSLFITTITGRAPSTNASPQCFP